MRLLIVEDNKELAKLLAEGLSRAKYDSDLASSVEDAKVILGVARFAAIVLDLGLPDGSGLDVLRYLRERGDPTPVIVLTARDSVTERVAGLRAGADDYMAKPFAFEELIARIEALLRRPGNLLGNSLRLANLAFDTQAKQAFVDDAPQNFPQRETAVLELLLRRAGRVVPKQMVEDQIFGLTSDVGSNAVEVYVHRLRKHLQEFGAGVEIHTIRGVGYLIAEIKEEAS